MFAKRFVGWVAALAGAFVVTVLLAVAVSMCKNQ